MSYVQSASVYDAIYTAMKNYLAESRRVTNLIEHHARRPVKTVFDVACGTGLHAQYLINNYKVTGIDLSPQQLAIARTRLPDVDLYEDDMRIFDIEETADAIVCLFSAIGHLGSVGELHQTIANFASHLHRGGVIIIEPWLLPHMWHPANLSFDAAVDDPDLKVARVGRSTRDGNVIHLQLEHLIGRPEGNEHFVETHDLMMFTEGEFHAAFAAAGLESSYDLAGISRNGRGVFIATKPLD